VQYSGTIQEISVIFKPFGICRFFRDHYQSIAARFSQSLDHPAWIQFGESLFNANDQMALLEEFLLSQYKEDDEITRLDGSLTLLHDLHNNYSVMDIADKLDYNVKTFQRHFAKHMSCSPVEYRRIIKFRNSIESKLSADEVKSLTGICYDSNYFDQSHFIKEFKKLTHRNPKEFFKVVKQVDGGKIVWEIV
jgi:AraC-like DNA-binding protein